MIKKIFNNKKYIAIISILGILLVSGITYALVNWTSNNYSITIKSSCMNINYTKGQDIDKSLGVIDESFYISGNTITMNTAMAFSSVDVGINSQCDVNGLATVEVNVTSLSNDLKSGGKYFGALKYVVVEYDPTNYTELTMSELSGDNFTFVGKGIIYNTGTTDAYTTYIEHGQEKNYLIIFYTDKGIIKNDLVNLSFDGSIGARVEQFVPTPITDFKYTLTNGNVRITKYNGTATKVNLAPTYTINGVEYNTVVYGSVFSGKTTVQEVFFAPGIIADSGNISSMFSGCSNLTKVSGLPSNITSMIGAFQNCTSLTNTPLIPSTVTNMDSSFKGCTNLVNISNIGASVSNLSYTFYGCTSLVNAPLIPDSVIIMNYTFQNCTSLVNVPVLGNSVSSMLYTFSGCRNLVNVSAIPNSVISMNYTFQNCTSLVNAPSLGNSVSLMRNTFYGCTSLVNAPTIPSSVTDMNNTFQECTSLVNAPTILSSIPALQNTFAGCTSLVNAPIIPNSVASLYETFLNCTSLVNAPTIPSSVTNMTSTFKGCTNLTGTIRINSSSVTRTSGATYHPFYQTSLPITVEVPSGSTTYTNINNNKPNNVTISTYTS